MSKVKIDKQLEDTVTFILKEKGVKYEDWIIGVHTEVVISNLGLLRNGNLENMNKK